MTLAQRLKRVFNIDIEVCSRCGGSVKVIACIEEQDAIDRILAHLESKKQNTPALPHLAPPTQSVTWDIGSFRRKRTHNLCLANSYFKLPPATEIIRDSVFSIGSRSRSWHCRHQAEQEYHRHGWNITDTRCNRPDSP